MSLSDREIEALLGEILLPLKGSRLHDVCSPDPYCVVLELRPSSGGSLFLLLSTRPRLSRFHLIPQVPESREETSPFARALRRRLGGFHLVGLRQVGDERILEATLARGASPNGPEEGQQEGFPPTVPGEESERLLPPRAPGEELRRLRLVLEIREGRGSLVLVGDDGRLLETLHPLRRGTEEIRPGEPYRFPAPRPPSSALKAATPSPWRLLESCPAQMRGDTEMRVDTAGEATFPLNVALAARYARIEADEIFSERRSTLLTSLKRVASRRSRLIDNVRADLARAEAGEEYRKKGELLKSHFAQLHRGLREVELADYSQPEGGTIRVELDPALGPRENLEAYFRRYQKLKRAVPVLAERLQTLEVEPRPPTRLGAGVERAPELEALRPLEKEAARFLSRPRPAKAKGLAASPALGPRRFVSSGGHEILVGRSARGNDELTLKIARGNDVFLHVAGRPGAHVIVRAVRGKTAPLETLLDAAQLAIYYSLPERSHGAAAGGMVRDVDYTQVKHVRKPRGFKPGLVLLANHKTLRVRLDLERLKRVQRSAGESQPQEPGKAGPREGDSGDDDSGGGDSCERAGAEN